VSSPAAPQAVSSREVAVAGLAWLLLVLALDWRALLGDEAFFYRDVFRQYWPLQEAVAASLARGELPFWNPSTQGGVPLLANLHAGVFYAPFRLFNLLEFHRAYAWLVWLHHASLGLGFQLALRGQVGRAAASLGAAAVGLSAYAVGAQNYLPLLVGLSFLGWQLVALRLRRWEARVAVLAVLLAAPVVAGDPFPALLGSLLLAAATWQQGRGLRGALELAAAGALAGLLAGCQLLPAWALYRDSARAAMGAQAALAWSFHPARLLEWVVETPFGTFLEAPGFTRFELARGPDARPFLMSHHLGLVPLALGVVGLALAHGRARWAALGLLLTGLGLSLGEHTWLSAAVLSLPPFSWFRYPEKYQWLCVVGVAWLAALGLEALGQRPGRLAVLRLAVPGLAAVELLLAGQRLVWLLPHPLLHEAPATAPLVRAGPGRLWRASADIAPGEPPTPTLEAAVETTRSEVASWASALPGLFGVEELGGYSPVALDRWRRTVARFAHTPDVLFRMFGVRWLVTRPELVSATRRGFRRAAELPRGLTLFEYRAPLPRLFAVREARPAASLDAALEAMAQPDFDPAVTALREGSRPPEAFALTSLEASGHAAGLAWATTDAPGPGYVVLSETAARGWVALVDGALAPADVVDGTLLGLPVPAGRHQVRFEYRQPGWWPGVAATLAGVLALGALLWRARAAPPSGR
jgi:hypothetical protein